MIRLAATLVSVGTRCALATAERAIAVTAIRRELTRANTKVAALERKVNQLTRELAEARESNIDCLRRESMLRRKHHQKTGEPC